MGCGRSAEGLWMGCGAGLAVVTAILAIKYRVLSDGVPQKPRSGNPAIEITRYLIAGCLFGGVVAGA